MPGASASVITYKVIEDVPVQIEQATLRLDNSNQRLIDPAPFPLSQLCIVIAASHHGAKSLS